MNGGQSFPQSKLPAGKRIALLNTGGKRDETIHCLMHCSELRSPYAFEVGIGEHGLKETSHR